MSMRKANSGASYVPAPSAALLRKRAAEKAARPAGARPDGRASAALRPVFMENNVVSRAVGSAYYEARATKVICSVYGPRPSQRKMQFSEAGTVQCDVKFAPFARSGARPRDGQSDEEKELSLTVLRAIEASIMTDKFPKSVLDVYVVIISDCGSTTAACINCTALALVNAGIELFDVVTAASVVGIPTDDGTLDLRVDPLKEEEDLCTSSLTVAQMPSLEEVTLLQQSGRVLPKDMLNTTRLGLDATAVIHRMMTKRVTDGVEPVLTDAGSNDSSDSGDSGDDGAVEE